ADAGRPRCPPRPLSILRPSPILSPVWHPTPERRSPSMLSPLRALPLLLACASAALAANWPAWRGPTGDGRSPETDAPLNSPGTAGKRVIASLGSAGVVCYDFAGKELWRKDLGKLLHIWGNASSPILYKDLVILWCGPGERQFLIALDKATGAQVWKYDEPGGKFGKEPADWLGSWSTPLVIRAGDHDELILPVPHQVKAFDPATGKVLWWCDGLGPLVYTSPVYSADGIAVVMSGFHGPALAVRVGGQGDVTTTHRLWQHGKG